MHTCSWRRSSAGKQKEFCDAASVDVHKGLHPAQVEERREQFGPNELPPEEATPFWQLVLKQFDDLMVKILLAAALVSTVLAGYELYEDLQAELSKNNSGTVTVGGFFQGITEHPLTFVEPFVILVILIFNAIVGVLQESRAEAAIAALKEMEPNEASVVRQWAHHDGSLTVEERKLNAAELVPGDIVRLRTGDMVPADCRVVHISTKSLKTDQAALTGESEAVQKYSEAIGKANVLQDKRNMCFSSTNVVAGDAVVVVVQTGSETEFGKIAKSLTDSEEETTPLQEKLDEFGSQLGWVILLICIAVFLINLPRVVSNSYKGEALDKEQLVKGLIKYFKIAVSLAVAAIPEGLPAVVTICLALGTQKMAKKNAIVRTLPSVETLGCCTVICSDKTGTLTTNKMKVQNILVPGAKSGTIQKYDVGGPPDFTPEGPIGNLSWPAKEPNLAKLAEVCVICNQSQLTYDTDKSAYVKSGEATEAALKVLAEKIGYPGVRRSTNRQESARQVSDEIAERVCSNDDRTVIEFTRDRKSMSVLAGRNLYTKGAPELLLNRCSSVMLSTGAVVPMDNAMRKKLDDELLSYAKSALRVLALAYAPNKDASKFDLDNPAQVLKFESDLTFVGFAAMIDPPRAEVKASIETCYRAGIRVIVITGDNKLTAESICRSIGVFGKNENLSGKSYEGQEFIKMPRSKQIEAVNNASLFARVEPAHKQAIVELLQQQGEVAAMTGDGVNDAPALKKANIGIAMGITGTAVAKGAADMVLADDNFSTIVAAVEEGRAIYINTKQFIRFLVSSNIGEVVSIFVTNMLGLPDSLQAVQLLWVNLVTDGPPATALGFNPTDDDLMKRPPRHMDDKIINGFQFLRYMVIGCYVGVATVLGFIYYYMYYSAGPRISWDELRSWQACEEEESVAGQKTMSELGISCYALFTDNGEHWKTGSCMSLTILVVIEMFNALNSVSEGQSVFVVPPFVNMKLIVAVLISIGLHVLILSFELSRKTFKIEWLDGELWAFVIAICLPVILLDEVFKLYARMTETADEE
jgi:Ca2+ transporting ATPase